MEKVPATPPDVDQPLRAACIHGRYDKHDFHIVEDEVQFEPCLGGRDITINQSFVEFVIRDEVATWPQWRDEVATWPQWKVEHVAQRVIAAVIGGSDDW